MLERGKRDEKDYESYAMNEGMVAMKRCRCLEYDDMVDNYLDEWCYDLR